MTTVATDQPEALPMTTRQDSSSASPEPSSDKSSRTPPEATQPKSSMGSSPFDFFSKTLDASVEEVPSSDHTARTMRRPLLSMLRFIRCDCENCVEIPDAMFATDSAIPYSQRKKAQERKQNYRRAVNTAKTSSTAACKAVDALKTVQETFGTSTMSSQTSFADESTPTPSSTATSATSSNIASPGKSFDNKSSVRGLMADDNKDIPSHVKCRRLLAAQSVTQRRKLRAILEKKCDYLTPLFRRISGMDFDSLFGAPTAVPTPQAEAPTGEPAAELKNEGMDNLGPVSSRGSSDWVAEVVVIGNSMPSIFKAYIDSLRSQHLLDCKGVEYFHVDISLDHGDEFPDAALVRQWRDLDWVFRDRRKPGKNDILVPQILIDGVPIGGALDLLTLEDDHDLDYILARELCPNCLADRKTSLDMCAACGVSFREMVSLKFLTPQQVERLMNRNICNAARVSAPLAFEDRHDVLLAAKPITKLSLGSMVEIPM